MSVKRASVGFSVVLLGLLTITVAESSLMGLLFLFSYVLKLNLIIQLGDRVAGAGTPGSWGPTVTLFNAGVVGSFLATALGGMVAATWKAKTWRRTR